MLTSTVQDIWVTYELVDGFYHQEIDKKNFIEFIVLITTPIGIYWVVRLFRTKK